MQAGQREAHLAVPATFAGQVFPENVTRFFAGAESSRLFVARGPEPLAKAADHRAPSPHRLEGIARGDQRAGDRVVADPGLVAGFPDGLVVLAGI